MSGGRCNPRERNREHERKRANERKKAWHDRRGVAHYTVGYNIFTFDRLHADLKTLSGKHPMIVEWALAGVLPGDERGDHFHFSTDGGIDTGPHGDGIGGGYLFCDGDNSADDPNGKPRPPVMYTIQQIAAAQPIGYVVVTATPIQPPAPPPVDWQAKYEALVSALGSLLKSAR